MPSAAWFIDGFNLYHSLTERPETAEFKWLNLWALAERFTPSDQRVERVVFFSARAFWDPGKARRHETYCDALKHTGVEVVLGDFQVSHELCKADCGKLMRRHSEKRTDVSLALSTYIAAASGRYKAIYLLTGDTDQVPTVESIRALNAAPILTSVFPPKRQSAELQSVADRCEILGKKSFKGLRLAAKIVAPGRTIRCPGPWLWPGADPESVVSGL